MHCMNSRGWAVRMSSRREDLWPRRCLIGHVGDRGHVHYGVTVPDDNTRVETNAVLVMSATRKGACKLGLTSKQVDALLKHLGLDQDVLIALQPAGG